MQKFTKLTTTMIPLALDNVDTDMIIPAQFLTSVSKSGYGENVFHALRKMYPDFILNNADYNQGQVLLSKNNFGCGSSREHAVWAIAQYGIKVVVCSSFSDIFFNNSAKNGLLLIKLPEDVINCWLDKSLSDANLSVVVDLAAQTISFAGECYDFDYDSYRKHCLINGLDDLDFLVSIQNEIHEYEVKKGLING